MRKCVRCGAQMEEGFAFTGGGGNVIRRKGLGGKAVYPNGHEFTGLGVSPRLDVVAVTQRLWEMNPSVPRNLYVVEELNIDDMVTWQSATGEVFLTVGQAQPVKTAESLSQCVCHHSRYRRL